MFELISKSNLLAGFTQRMLKERDRVVEARKNSGLDDIFEKSREQYQGIDEINRERSVSKARTLDGPITTTMGSVGEEDRSTVFVNITRPYTNAATAHAADVVDPTGNKKNWKIELTPVSEIAILQAYIGENPEIAGALPEELALRVNQSREEQETSMKLAQLMIDDWLTEAKWSKQIRDQMAEAWKTGSGVIRGPFAKRRVISPEIEETIERVLLVYEDAAIGKLKQDELRMRLLYQPALECIPVENCYPDMPACGDDIQNGRFFWEKIPSVSKIELKELLEDGAFFEDQLRLCLSEDPLPDKSVGEVDSNKKNRSYTRWRRIGEIELGDLLSEEELDSSGLSPTVWVEAEFVNEHCIRISTPALDGKVFRYRILNPEKRSGSWAGVGVPEQMETPQRGLNASVRAGNDNMGWSVGFQVILGKGLEAIQGASNKLERYKVWRDVTDSLEVLTGKSRSVRDAITSIEFPNHLDRILPWINFWLQMAETTTGLSLLLQGQKVTDSVGVSQQLGKIQSTNLKLFVKHWDVDICEPIIQDFYQWTQKYGPDSVKGDAVARALGSSVLIVRDLQQQALLQLLDRFVQPVYGKSPRKGMDLILEALQFDPGQLDLDEEERQRLEEAANTPDPKVQVEQMRSDTDRFVAKMEDATTRMKAMLDAQLKGMSLDQAADAIETQAAGNLALEGLKQEGEKEKMEAGPEVSEEEKSSSSENSDISPSIDESLAILGLAR